MITLDAVALGYLIPNMLGDIEIDGMKSAVGGRDVLDGLIVLGRDDWHIGFKPPIVPRLPVVMGVETRNPVASCFGISEVVEGR